MKQIGVGSVNIDKQGRKYVLDALKTNRLTYGKYTQKFEKEFARLHNRRFAIFCNSGTSALQVAVNALKNKYQWKDGSEVLVPALTFVASVNVILQNNLKPVFVDVEKDFYCMNPSLIEDKITPQTVGIEPVHLAGQSADMEKILAISKKYKLKTIEDSCEAMFVNYRGKPVGSQGDIACFSTYAAHIIVTGVGGFATTNDPQLALIMKSLFNHGRDGIYISIDDDGREKRDFFDIVARRFNFTDIGYSYRATELEAALGVAQLETWKENIKKRQQNGEHLTYGLKDLEKYLQLPKIRPNSGHCFMFYPVVIREEVKLKRRDLINFLEKNGIETRFLLPLLNQPVYRKLFGNIEKQYPVAHHLSNNAFYIGSHPDLTRGDLDYILEKFHEFFKRI